MQEPNRKLLNIDKKNCPFLVTLTAKNGNKINVNNFSDLPYDYRDHYIAKWCEDRNLFKIKHKLFPTLCFRI